MTIREAYDTLGLDASSTTPDEGRSRFHDLILLNHPDGKPSHEQARASETTRVIVEACTLLRTQGFPHVLACKGTAAARVPRYERPATATPASVDPLGWVDELWRECVHTNLVCAFAPAFGVRLAFGAWTMGWELMWGTKLIH